MSISSAIDDIISSRRNKNWENAKSRIIEARRDSLANDVAFLVEAAERLSWDYDTQSPFRAVLERFIRSNGRVAVSMIVDGINAEHDAEEAVMRAELARALGHSV